MVMIFHWWYVIGVYLLFKYICICMCVLYLKHSQGLHESFSFTESLTGSTQSRVKSRQ